MSIKLGIPHTVLRVTSGLTVVDLRDSQAFTIQLTGNTIVRMANISIDTNEIMVVYFRIVQDAAGSRTLTWPSNFVVNGQGAVNSTALSTSLFEALTFDRGTTWELFNKKTSVPLTVADITDVTEDGAALLITNLAGQQTLLGIVP